MRSAPRDKGKPRLKLVTGASVVVPSDVRDRKTRGGIVPGIGVTMKEEGFCQGICNGLSQSDAFRASHNTDGMKAETVHYKASLMMGKERVQQRIEVIRAGREERGLHDAAKARAWALKRLETEAEHGDSPGARVRAIELVMRHHALLTDRTEVDVHDQRSSAEMLTELEARLAALVSSNRSSK